MIKNILYICIILPTILMSNHNIKISLEHNLTNNIPLEVTLKVTNISDENTSIDLYNFILDNESIVKNIFTVKEDGKKVPYSGMIIFGLTPKEKILSAGETYYASINIADYYMVSEGTHYYEIFHTTTNVVSLEIEATIPSKKEAILKFNADTCNNNQLSKLINDQKMAEDISLNTTNHLLTSNHNHTLYRKWFGQQNSSRYNIVYQNYKKIYSGLGENISYDCSPPNSICNSAIAFVYRYFPNKINICNNYWKYPHKASVLIHEMSHFNKISNTNDGDGNNKYIGNNAAMTLANINPDLAIHNAYSYGSYAQEVGIGNGGGNNTTVWITGAYTNNQDISKVLNISNASILQVTITGTTEENYDYIYIYNDKGQEIKKLHGNINTTFIVSGSSIKARLTSDYSITKSGVKVSIIKIDNSGNGRTTPLYYEFNQNSNAQGWNYQNLTQYKEGPIGGAWYFIANYNDPQLISPTININANVLKKIVIQMANDHNPAYYSSMQIFWKKSGQAFSEANSKTISVTNHGGWTTYTIDMSQTSRWNGEIEAIRIDPIYQGDGHWLAFNYIHITP